MAAILVLHVLVVAVAMLMKGPRPDAEERAVPIEVMMLTDSRPAAPTLKVKMEEMLPQSVMPAVQIDLPLEPSAATITVAAAPAPAPPSPAESTGDDGPVSISAPDYVQMPNPIYPPAAKRARAQGIVHVQALVDVEGRAQQVEVARSSGFAALDRAACDAVLRAVFKPYRRNNVARSMRVIVPIEFSLAVRTVAAR
jgi:protein TonB